MLHHDDIVEEIATKRQGTIDEIHRYIIEGREMPRINGACISSMGMSRFLDISSTKRI